MLAIGQLNDNDDHFSFGDGKFLAFKTKIGKWNKGTTLCILFIGQIKHYCQWTHNFSLDLILLTREAFVKAKVMIEKYTHHEALIFFWLGVSI